MDSNPYSGLEVDSITDFHEYIDLAKENGMKAIAFTEHGCVLHNIAKKQACEKAGIKYIHAEEFYVTEKIDVNENKDEANILTRDNYHCSLFARNYDGVRELNALSSKSFDRTDGHFYYNPRITLDELINTSDNILVLTACVGGILCRGTSTAQEKFLKFIIDNKDRCWLEIQPHNFKKQILYNQYLYRISNEYNLKLIATNDIHAVDARQLDGRKMMQLSKKIDFHDEDACDLSFKNYQQLVEAFERQGALNKSVYMAAIAETNSFAGLIEDYKLDYSNKYPRSNNAKEEFKKRIKDGIKKRGIDKLPNYKTEYVPRIKEEFKTYEHNDAIDFMLLDSDYKKWMLSNGMHYGPSRGSVSGSEIAYLLNCTDVDSVKYKLNFSRFMNPERQSLADIDTDIYADDRYKVREYLFNREDLNCCNIITFNTIKMRGAIKDIGRACGYTPEVTQEISNTVYEDENGKECVPDEIRKQYRDIFMYVDLVVGTITSLGRHAAGIVCSPTDITKDFGTLSITSDPRRVSQIDMHEIDSLNYVKIDLLGLNAVGLISKTCEFAGISYLTPDNINLNDENVIKSIAEDTTLIFQFESGFASDSLKRTLSDETVRKIKAKNPDASYLDIMSMVSGAIRPAGESYRDRLFNGEYNDNGNKALNDFLAPTLGFLVYQEQVIEFLHKFCGFTMGQADIVRRGFAKKTGTGQYMSIIENGGYMVDIHGNKDDRYIKGFVVTAQEEYGMTENEAREVIKYFLKVIEDASSYLFSKNHSDPYSMIGYFIGWLRYYYPLQLFTAALIIYQDNEEKSINIKNYIKSKGIDIKPAKFGKSKGEYYMDVDQNVIYQGIGAIKYCNYQIGEELYALASNKYDSFVELLKDIYSETSIKNDQLEILIKLNYFSDFGNNKYLLGIKDLYDKFGKAIVLKKDKVASLNISEELIRKYCDKETEKQYRGIDNIGLIKELSKTLQNIPLNIREQIGAEKDYLGNCVYTNERIPENYYIVVDYITYKDPCRPYFTCYNIHNGTSHKTRINNNKTYKHNPFGEYSILEINEFTPSFKKKKNAEGKWVVSDEIEEILEKYEVIKK